MIEREYMSKQVPAATAAAASDAKNLLKKAARTVGRRSRRRRVLKADKNLNTLIDFRYKRKFVAKRGGHGGNSNCTGPRADDVIVKVPLGTLVRDDATGVRLADLTEDGQEYVIAKGGRGGKGNACYVTSTNRAPTFAEKGEPGELRWIKLELKLLADVGLVGYPSVGKSSIIAQVSAARPEIAAYHFTTLTLF